ncbi:MAG: helix-turn-helix domain-containing protein, partial [Flavobacteriales bacterium]|nr:helix-turn-helix domain-containing protein [Flavobacteriales bacterium]
MLKEGYNQAQIAKAIGKNKSVVSRELKRNSDARNNVYTHELATYKYAKRQKEKHKHKRFTALIQLEVERLLKEDYSPEQIVGTLIKQGKECVSVERI